MIKLILCKELLSAVFFFVFLKSYSQNQNTSLGVRIAGQIDLQKEFFAPGGFFGGLPSFHKAAPFNYGIDVLAFKKNIKGKTSLYGGIGYFRNRFNFRKPYDHQLLNPEVDSIPIGTVTQNYVYSLLRFPFGLDFNLTARTGKEISLSIENIFNCSFLQTYNGSKPFPNANNKFRRFRFYGYNLLIEANLKQLINHKTDCYIIISPYVRIFNLYNHNDPVLYKDEIRNYIRWIDAIGLSVQYSFKLKNRL